MNNVPEISVGILLSDEIEVRFHGAYTYASSSDIITGKRKVKYLGENFYDWEGGDEDMIIRSGILFEPVDIGASFTIHNVVIGLGFHWERKEDQVFSGAVKFVAERGKLRAINVISLEDYLKSVISSEMSATSSLELLKAHSVISRSWLLAQIDKSNSLLSLLKDYQSEYKTDDEYIKWYDREDHEGFDVCADDHCQRYQGITRATTQAVEEAVDATHGIVLMDGDEICDARFSKCCGGMVEKFENVWEPVSHSYLNSFVDGAPDFKGYHLDLTSELNARNWIQQSPDVFCNTDNKEILSQVLNDYDQETNDFFRWKVEYSQSELSALVQLRTGLDFGMITDLVPIERGDSGRIIKLKIIGEKKTLVIGKELEIRKSLSKSHLYSSAFIIDKREVEGELRFTLHGAGWGHGVGLCQIGAAVMGAQGYDYKSILDHYFRGAELKKKY